MFFDKDVDHQAYLLPDIDSLAEAPGFPFMRVHPGLAGREPRQPQPAADEQLLLTLHLRGGHIMVLSDRRLLIYQLPLKKNMLQQATGKAIGLIPGIGDALDALDDLKFGHRMAGRGFRTVKNWFTGEADQIDAERIALGLPPEKETRNLIWDLRDLEAVMVVTCYSDAIFLHNGFHWKEKLSWTYGELNDSLAELILDKDRITCRLDGRKKFRGRSRKEWNAIELLAQLALESSEELEQHGFTVEMDHECVVVRNY